LVAQVRMIAEAIDELDREVSVDSSIVRAHQHAAGARRTTAFTCHGGLFNTEPGKNLYEVIAHRKLYSYRR
jgi:hypothetical protein